MSKRYKLEMVQREKVMLIEEYIYDVLEIMEQALAIREGLTEDPEEREG